MIKYLSDKYYSKAYIEKYLEEKARQGYILKKVYLNFLYKFEKKDPEQINYKFVLYSPSDYNTKYLDKAKKDIGKIEDMGWEIINRDLNFFLLASHKDIAKPEILDELNYRDFLKKKSSSFMWKLPIFLLIIISTILTFISSYKSNIELAKIYPHIFESYKPDILGNLKNDMIFSAILMAIAMFFFICSFSRDIYFYYKNKKAFKNLSMPIHYLKSSFIFSFEFSFLLSLVFFLVHRFII